MTCLDEATVADFVEGRLPDDLRNHAETHMAHCSICRRWVAQIAAGSGSSEPNDAPSAPTWRLLRTGETIGRYRVEARIGQGAMGAVYAARDITLDRDVALKVLRVQADTDLRLQQARMLREARAIAVVRHPNVVPVHDVFELDDGTPVLVMDLLRGETLRSLLVRQGRLSLSETIRCLRPVLLALDAAHRQGVIHRDLKPDNIFLEDSAEPASSVRVLDFGVAKLARTPGTSDTASNLTATGVVVGTPAYMAPEQAFGEGEIDQRADLWSFGVMLYECLSGRRPIEAPNVGQCLRRLARLSLDPIEPAVAQATPGLETLLAKLLCDRSERFSSAHDVLTALDQLGLPQSRRAPSGRTIALLGLATFAVIGSTLHFYQHQATSVQRMAQSRNVALRASRSPPPPSGSAPQSAPTLQTWRPPGATSATPQGASTPSSAIQLLKVPPF